MTDTHTPDDIESAQAFVRPLLESAVLESGESIFAHADAVASILESMGADATTQVSAYLLYAWEHLRNPREILGQAFGESATALAEQAWQLYQVQRQALREALPAQGDAGQLLQQQTENVRKMLLAFSRDVRVVVLRLASRLQTLRYLAACKQPLTHAQHHLVYAALHIFSPLANRLGLGTIKWEMEDLAFRFLEPETYRDIAFRLENRRQERESHVAHLVRTLEEGLFAQGLNTQVQGRPKHIYSIVKKMRGKSLAFHQVMDITALRIIVQTPAACYEALSWVHEHYAPVDGEFDDYIARPKANGYQSIHTVVRDAAGRPAEIQIRTHAMHEHAEHGVAAHWVYKESGRKGYTGVSASGSYEHKIALLRQLLAWERDLTTRPETPLFDDRIYVLTPEAAVVELAQGATPVDFAYAVHTTLGHRCRGAKVDGAMVPLSTPLSNGQTVEIIASKEGGPSRDWLNAELAFLQTARARAKVRAWFNAQQLASTISQGRSLVEKLLQREGKTATNLEAMAHNLGFKSADQLFEQVGKDALPLRHIEQVLRPLPASSAPPAGAAPVPAARSVSSQTHNILVAGAAGMMTQLARCCKPLPADAIGGFVTRGKGISIHRVDCSSYQRIVAHDPARALPAAWGHAAEPSPVTARFEADISILAQERSTLLRDITEILAKEKVAFSTASSQTRASQQMLMRFTLTVGSTSHLQNLLAKLARVEGILNVRRV